MLVHRSSPFEVCAPWPMEEAAAAGWPRSQTGRTQVSCYPDQMRGVSIPMLDKKQLQSRIRRQRVLWDCAICRFGQTLCNLRTLLEGKVRFSILHFQRIQMTKFRLATASMPPPWVELWRREKKRSTPSLEIVFHDPTDPSVGPSCATCCLLPSWYTYANYNQMFSLSIRTSSMVVWVKGLFPPAENAISCCVVRQCSTTTTTSTR